MKAILLAGGFGTRLRPLTLNLPKATVPIFDRPFLYYQIDLLKQLPEIDEVILSLNYQPEAVKNSLPKDSDIGLDIRYLVEPKPLGTGGAIKFSEKYLNNETVLVLNGDVLTHINLSQFLALHQSRKAHATIALTPVDNPSSYGLVETDTKSNVLRFLEKPNPNEIHCNTINAGIYLLEPNTFNRIPPNTKYSIERSYFPSLIENHETFVAYINEDYWIDIGTPGKYLQAHRDIMNGKYQTSPFTENSDGKPFVHKTADIAQTAQLFGPCFVGARAKVEAGASLKPHSTVCQKAIVGTCAQIDGSLISEEAVIGAHAIVHNAIIGRRVRIEQHTKIGPGVVIGDDSIITSYSSLS